MAQPPPSGVGPDMPNPESSVGALVLMGILWGAFAVRCQQTTGDRGVLAEVVDVVVEEAKDAADSAKRVLPGSAPGESETGRAI